MGPTLPAGCCPYQEGGEFLLLCAPSLTCPTQRLEQIPGGLAGRLELLLAVHVRTWGSCAMLTD